MVLLFVCSLQEKNMIYYYSICHHSGCTRLDYPIIHQGRGWIIIDIDALGIHHRRRKIDCCIHHQSENSQLGELDIGLHLRLA